MQTVERSHKVLFESMIKTTDDCKCDLGTALLWAASGKNCLQNVYGYSSNQLVFGSNVSLPSVITNLPPALVSTTSSDKIPDNLNAFHKARKNFIKAESSEKIQRALSHNVRTFNEEIYKPGERYSVEGKSQRIRRNLQKFLVKKEILS